MTGPTNGCRRTWRETSTSVADRTADRVTFAGGDRGGMSGLIEILAGRGGREDLPNLAHLLTFEVDDLLPLVDAAQMLGFAERAER